jgi:hypothetical protein
LQRHRYWEVSISIVVVARKQYWSDSVYLHRIRRATLTFLSLGHTPTINFDILHFYGITFFVDFAQVFAALLNTTSKDGNFFFFVPLFPAFQRQITIRRPEFLWTFQQEQKPNIPMTNDPTFDTPYAGAKVGHNRITECIRSLVRKLIRINFPKEWLHKV